MKFFRTLLGTTAAIALSAVPASFKPGIYALGRHHKRSYDPGTPLPFPTSRSARHDLIIPAPAFRVTEWRITDRIDVGSHTCFHAVLVGETQHGTAAQLAHVSALFAQKSSKAGKPFIEI